MGLLIEGRWADRWYDTKGSNGRFVRQPSRFRRWVTADGKPGADGQDAVPAEAGRYHLYVSYACPWAHRTLIVRALKGLEDLVPISVVHWRMLENGWTFDDGPGVVPDPVIGAAFLRDIYTLADPAYSGRVTVPVLFDLKERTIVNNESSEIIRMFDGAFDHLGAKPGTFRPKGPKAEIDVLNARIYETVNNGVYRAGFATSQEAYEEAVVPLFETLDKLEERLAQSRYLFGDAITEADIRLLPTLIRFDAVYVGHFKCNLKRLVDYPNLWAYTRDVCQLPEIAGTIHMDHAKRHYYESHRSLNPSGIVPLGPEVDFSAPHGREGLSEVGDARRVSGR